MLDEYRAAPVNEGRRESQSCVRIDVAECWELLGVADGETLERMRAFERLFGRDIAQVLYYEFVALPAVEQTSDVLTQIESTYQGLFGNRFDALSPDQSVERRRQHLAQCRDLGVCFCQLRHLYHRYQALVCRELLHTYRSRPADFLSATELVAKGVCLDVALAAAFYADESVNAAGAHGQG